MTTPLDAVEAAALERFKQANNFAGSRYRPQEVEPHDSWKQRIQDERDELDRIDALFRPIEEALKGKVNRILAQPMPDSEATCELQNEQLKQAKSDLAEAQRLRALIGHIISIRHIATHQNPAHRLSMSTSGAYREQFGFPSELVEVLGQLDSTLLAQSLQLMGATSLESLKNLGRG